MSDIVSKKKPDLTLETILFFFFLEMKSFEQNMVDQVSLGVEPHIQLQNFFRKNHALKDLTFTDATSIDKCTAALNKNDSVSSIGQTFKRIRSL